MKRRIPKYRKLQERIQKEILGGQYRPGSRMPTVQDLLKRYQVSGNTLHHALAELERLGQIVRRHGSGTFISDMENPPLIPGRHLRIGLLWRGSVRPENLKSGFGADLVRGVLEAWHIGIQDPFAPLNGTDKATRLVWNLPARGLTLECLGSSPDSRRYHPDLEAVQKGNYDGLISLGVIETGLLQSLLQLNIPMVLADYPDHTFNGQVDRIYADPMSGYEAVVRDWVARGLTRIHFFGAMIGPSVPDEPMDSATWARYVVDHLRPDPDTHLRAGAWRKAMQVHGLTVQDDWIHHETFNPKRIEPIAIRLTQLPDSIRPQAFLCHSHSQAEALIGFFRRDGIRLEAAGAADCSHPGGRAGMIRVNARQMGAIAAEQLLARLTRPNRHFLNIGVDMVHEAASQTGTLAPSSSNKERAST